MPATVKVRNVSPLGALDVVLWPGDAPRTVGAGETLDVPPEIAGQAPHWRALDPGEADAPGAEHRDSPTGRQVRDLGSGLLAQEINWQPVPAAPAAPKGD